MAQYTDFSNIDSGANNTIAGLIEMEETGAVGFRYIKEVIADGLPPITRVLRDDWLIEVWERKVENPDDKRVLFRQRVNFGLNIVAVPGLFIAYPAEDEQIETTIINGEIIAPGDAKLFLDLGYLEEFGITADFSASQGVNGGVARGTWMSLPYRLDLPFGAYFHIVRDGWRPIGLSRIATYRTSYLPGDPRLAALFDEVGAIRTARPRGGGVVLSHCYPAAGFDFVTRRARLKGEGDATLRDAAISKDETNRLWLSAYEGSFYRFFYSDDDGRSFRRHQLRTGTGQTMPIAIWKNGETFPDRAQSGFVCIAQRGTKILCKTSTDGLTWSEARFVAHRKRAEPYIVRVNPITNEIIVANGRLDHVLRSSDGGKKFDDITNKVLALSSPI